MQNIDELMSGALIKYRTTYGQPGEHTVYANKTLGYWSFTTLYEVLKRENYRITHIRIPQDCPLRKLIEDCPE